MTKRLFSVFSCVGAIVVLFLLAGCTYEYNLIVRVFDTSGDSAVTNVRVVVMKKAFDESDLSALISEPVNTAGELEVSLCCSPNPQVWVYAFIDANASSHWDLGERLQSAQNPVQLSDDATLDIHFD